FACSGMAGDEHHFASFHGEADLRQCCVATRILLADIVESQDCSHAVIMPVSPAAPALLGEPVPSTAAYLGKVRARVCKPAPAKQDPATPAATAGKRISAGC